MRPSPSLRAAPRSPVICLALCEDLAAFCGERKWTLGTGCPSVWRDEVLGLLGPVSPEGNPHPRPQLGLTLHSGHFQRLFGAPPLYR